MLLSKGEVKYNSKKFLKHDWRMIPFLSKTQIVPVISEFLMKDSQVGS